jgi:hypothetical protein
MNDLGAAREGRFLEKAEEKGMILNFPARSLSLSAAFINRLKPLAFKKFWLHTASGL